MAVALHRWFAPLLGRGWRKGQTSVFQLLGPYFAQGNFLPEVLALAHTAPLALWPQLAAPGPSTRLVRQYSFPSVRLARLRSELW